MDIVVLCDPGCEGVAARDVEELLRKVSDPRRGFVIVHDCSPEEMALLSYRSQAASRVLAYITDGELEGVDDILASKKALLAFDYAPFLSETGRFRVTCERHGEHAFQAKEVEEALGGVLFEGKQFKVDLATPDMTVWCHIVDECYVLGIDLSGRDLGKREYRAFHTRRSLRGTIAYAAVRSANHTGKERMVDAFCTDGGIAIEAALFVTRTPVQKFTKEFAFTSMPFAGKTDWDAFFATEDKKGLGEGKKGADGRTDANLTAFAPSVHGVKKARGNAKLAGVDKSFTVTKADVDWLDTKLEEGSVDLVVTQPPCSGKNTPLKEVEKLQDDLFYQARYILKTDGRVLLVAEKRAEFLNAAERHGFALITEQEVWQGGTKLLFLLFGKKGK